MNTYNVNKRVESDDNTNVVLIASFDNLSDAELKFNKELAKQETYGGEYLYENQPKNSYFEYLEIESLDEDEDFETVKEVVVYKETIVDKNNWKGNYACNYWAVAKFNGTELIYNFYDNGKDLNLEYADVKESDLNNWFNY